VKVLITSDAPRLEPLPGETFWGLFADRVALTPDTPMLFDEHGRRFTFREAFDWCERVAAGLSDMGIGAGTRISWQLPTKLETIVLSFALARLGAVQNPIIALYRGHEVGFLLKTTEAEWFAVPGVWRGFDFTAMGTELVAKLDHPCRLLVFDGDLPTGDPATLPSPVLDPNVIRWIYATSGTTSVPKAARHTDRSLIYGAGGLGRSYKPQSDEIGTFFFPYSHIGGPAFSVIMLQYGLGVLTMEAFVPDEAVRLMNEVGVTSSGGSTAFYLAFLAEQGKDPSKPFVPTLRYLNGGGAPKPPEVFWRVHAELGLPIYHGFGMTECTSMASCAYGDTDEQMANTDGAAVYGCEIEIRDDDDRLVPSGVVGEIVVRGPQLFSGYTDPELNAVSFDEQGFFRTGDRGLLREDKHIVITGRSKDMIIRKGENISPREIEDVLVQHPSVAAVAVIGLPDAERGERVCAVVELRPGAPAITFQEMQQMCRDAQLMTQKFPEQLEIMDALPRNPTMKILKRELRTTFGGN
jgi:acyl-CoA synthetase (AMP-forming)/AMP-acid ligase II